MIQSKPNWNTDSLPDSFHLTKPRRGKWSDNRKTGHIPTSISTRATCPPSCGLKDNGCYAEGFPLNVHWKQVSSGLMGYPFERFCEKVETVIPPGQLWRWAQAGDLPGDGVEIDFEALQRLVEANAGRRGYGYTHYPPSAHNVACVRYANQNGFVINWSAETLAQADAYVRLDAGPVAVVLPDDARVRYTPEWNTVVVCPADYAEGMTCAKCQMCAVAQRKAIIGFPAHGTRQKRAAAVARGGMD